MEECRLNDIPSFEGDSSAHQDKEDRGEGDDAQSTDLKKEDSNDLTQYTQILSDVDHD